MRLGKSRGGIAAISALLLGAVISVAAWAQTPPTGGADGMGAGGPPGGMQMPSPAEQAISYRKALFTVIGSNFTSIGGVLQGRAEFNGAELLKRAERTAQVAAMLDDAFPEVSKTGNTKAKADIWSSKAEFDKLNKDFTDHTATLAAVLKKDNKAASDAFKTAATAVAQDCRNCHDKFRAR